MCPNHQMTYCNVTIDRTEKDRFLNELSSYKRVHIKKSERAQVSEKSKDDALLLTLIQELERETKSLQVELDISDKHLDNLPVNEKVHIEATDFKDLVQGVSEEIHFYLNRVYELKKFIVKARIELENVHMLEICYKLLDTININKYNITFLDELELRLFTTFSKNEENLHELLNQAVFPNIYRTMSVSKERIAFFTLYPRFKFKELQERINLIHAEEIPILRKYLNYDGINFERINREIAYIVKTINRYEGEMDRIRDKIFLKIAATLEIIDNLKEYIWAMQQFNEISTSRIKLSFFVPTREKDRIYTDLERDFSPSINITMHDVKKHAGIDWNKQKEIISENRMIDDRNNDTIVGMTTVEKQSSLDERVGKLKRMKSESPIEVSQDSESVMGRRGSPKVEDEDIRTDTPTLMNHSGIVKPFETITKMFGTPAYSEIDPTPIIALTLPLLFGLMFGDIGHGLCLMISGLIGVKIFKRKGEKGNTMVAFAWIVFHFGWGAIIGGILYGEFFGMHDILGFHLQPLRFGSFTLHSPLNNILSIFKFTLIVGVIQINLGWAIQFLNYWRNKRKYMAFFDSFMKICILSGGTFVIFMHGFDINAWFNPPFPILLPLIPGIMLIISKPLGKLFKISYLEHEKTGELLSEGFMETFETVLSIMSNVASYVRILALALAHISLMICIDETVQLIPQEGAFSQVVRLTIAIGGNIIVIALEGILVMINNIRLHFYEFFFKFYQGNGIEFSPFNLNYNICEITLMKTKEKDVISEELTKQIAIEFDQDELEKAKIHLQKQYGA